MNFLLQELSYLRGALLRLTFAFLIFATAFFALPLPSGESPSVWVLQKIRADLVPHEVSLIITNPLDPFAAQVTLSVILALLLAVPLLLLEVWRFVSPGMYRHERFIVGGFVLAALFFWLLGSVFAYTTLVPAVFSALFAYVPEGVLAYFSLRELVSITAGLTFGVSFLFLLPVAMTLLAALGVVGPTFWRAYARHALLLALLASAIITPDGSGVTMMLLALPIASLYAAGYAGSVMVGREGHTLVESEK